MPEAYAYVHVRTPRGRGNSEPTCRPCVTEGNELAKISGQTSARWRVLVAIENTPASVARISRLMGLARQSVQRIADLLERDGLASFEENAYRASHA
jgi:DNA-binding MarR family transcriptional regulator